ncbi:hypothetical protein [Streptomyces sp. NRRL F-5193]|uniref:hypothetical protein n=1 Tax=Streptomyces sp. NRRL F-5193 TaxID=1463860 RepID=UPI00131C8315|nr:hypothetical protein [Streptomyces sp. NRRL F-5193]
MVTHLASPLAPAPAVIRRTRPDYARGRQGWLNRKNWGVGWSARGFKKDWGYSKRAKLSFPVARTVFRIKFGKGRKIDLFMGRWL